MDCFCHLYQIKFFIDYNLTDMSSYATNQCHEIIHNYTCEGSIVSAISGNSDRIEYEFDNPYFSPERLSGQKKL